MIRHPMGPRSYGACGPCPGEGDAARTARLPRDGARSFASSFGYEVRPDPGIVVWAAPPSRPSHREARGARGYEDLRERLT